MRAFVVKTVGAALVVLGNLAVLRAAGPVVVLTLLVSVPFVLWLLGR